MLCITFLRSSAYIKNPSLKSGLVTILFYGIWETYGRKKGILGDVLNALPFATEHLLHALMNFYIGIPPFVSSFGLSQPDTNSI